MSQKGLIIVKSAVAKLQTIAGGVDSASSFPLISTASNNKTLIRYNPIAVSPLTPHEEKELIVFPSFFHALLQRNPASDLEILVLSFNSSQVE